MTGNTTSDGDDIPDRTFAAVGHALTSWEHMEHELACSYTIFIGRAREVDALAEFGGTYRNFAARKDAVAGAAEAYFQRQPDQDQEGMVAEFLARALHLSIDRHRIAHGMVAGIPVLDPSKADENGWVGLSHLRYWLQVPWYATKSLRNEWVGIGSSEIDATASKFTALRTDIAAFNARHAPILSPEMFVEPQFLVAKPGSDDPPDHA